MIVVIIWLRHCGVALPRRHSVPCQLPKKEELLTEKDEPDYEPHTNIIVSQKLRFGG